MRLTPVSLILAVSLVASAAVAQTKSPESLSDFSRSIRDLTNRVSPAVVQISVTSYGPVNEDGTEAQVTLVGRQHVTGSGVIVDPAGYVVTNAHVVKGAIRVRVTVPPAALRKDEPMADTVFDARVIGVDAGTDLAVIKIDGHEMPALAFGDSDGLKQGEIVLALGSPLGLKNSVSMGVVSAAARQISEDNPLAFVQTDASINPGNSGGALVNAEGLLVGINSFIYTQSGGSQGIGFAIPSNIVQNVYQQLRTKGHVHRGEVGMMLQDITPTMAEGLKLPRRSGVVVSDVVPESTAASAGIQPNDILLSLDGNRLDHARDLELALYRRLKGTMMNATVLRDGKPLDKPVAIQVSEEEGENDETFADATEPEKHLVPRLGVLCLEIDARIAKLVPELRSPNGLVIAAKSPDGQSRYIDLKAGDVIHAMNAEPVQSLDTFKQKIADMKAGSAVVLQIERSGTMRFVAFEIE